MIRDFASRRLARRIGLCVFLLLSCCIITLIAACGDDGGGGAYLPDGGLLDPDGSVTSDGPADGALTDASTKDASDGPVEVPDANGRTVSIGNATALEGNFGATALTFAVTLSTPSTQTLTVDFATSDFSATSSNGAPGGADYTASSGTVTFAPGDITKNIVIYANGDTTTEPNETFIVKLSNAVGATISQGVGTGTISNDDAVPTISIGNALITEGNAGTTPAVFNVTLSQASGQTVTVNYRTTDVTATAASGDYVAIPTTVLTFAPGETQKTITVNVNGDTVAESNETFRVDLSAPTNAILVGSQGTATIQNDDGVVQPSISITDPSVTEGNVGTKIMTFAVTLSTPSAQTVTVDFKTTDGTAIAGGVAAAGGADYVANSNTLTFAPGITIQNVSITINGDTVHEGTETFTVDLSNAVNAIISKVKGTGTITNDDTSPSVTIADATITEGQAGTTALTFTISLSKTSGNTVTVNYATADGTATAGGSLSTGGQDYVASNASINFPPGTSTQTVSIIVNGDVLNEANETMSVTISAPVNATLGVKTTATGTITNDDPLPLIVISDASINEGNVGNASMTFNVTLVNAALAPTPSGRTVTVGYATSAVTAAAGSDFVATSGTLSFSAGQTAQIITVQIVGDTAPEGNETLSVDLSAAVNATISDGTAVGTINNDDGNLPFINVADTSVTEGNAGTTLMTFTVTLSAAAAADVTVDYATADSTAIAGGVLAEGGQDYVPTNNTLTFTAGQTSKTVTVTINGDVANEGNDALLLVLSNPSSNAVIQDGTGVGTITNDDPLPTVSIANASIAEGASGGTSTASFTVTLSAASGQPVTVSYSTADGTAQVGGVLVEGGQDYVATSDTLTFAPGETSKMISVTINGDATYEPNETFSVTLSGANNATLGNATATATITNDDSLPSITINDVALAEGSAGGATSFTFTVTLSNPSAQTVGVSWATADGTASHVGAQADYNDANGVLSIPPGATTGTVTVLVLQDTKSETDDTFFVNLTNPTNASIADGSGLGTIQNDD